jgi:hypothetical protein
LLRDNSVTYQHEHIRRWQYWPLVPTFSTLLNASNIFLNQWNIYLWFFTFCNVHKRIIFSWDVNLKILSSPPWSQCMFWAETRLVSQFYPIFIFSKRANLASLRTSKDISKDFILKVVWDKLWMNQMFLSKKCKVIKVG